METRLLRNRTFDHDQYDVEFRSGDEFFYRVKGRVRANGLATGYLIVFVEPHDPPDGANLAECTTYGKARWVAHKAR